MVNILHGCVLKLQFPQGSYFIPLFPIIYINDLTDNVASYLKSFADDT